MRESVAIIGGGVAGLSAAHELVERGFIVHLYERRTFFGGKAASYRIASSPGDAAAQPGAPELPGEHGFRFFPGWYRHLIDTMERIPFQRPGGGLYQGGTVAGNLVSVQTNLLAWFDRTPVALPLRLPRSAAEAGVATQLLTEFGRLGLSSGEIALFFKKLIQFVALTDDRRAQELEGITWWDYLECSRPGRSRAYKDLVRATTRTMVAAKAEEASAFSIGRLAVRTLLDTLSSVDRVLNGPTSEVWFGPWIAHLKSRGVIFHSEVELQEMQFDATSRKMKRVELEPVPISNARRLRALIALPLVDAASIADDDNLKGACDLVGELCDSVWLGAFLEAGEAAPYCLHLDEELSNARKQLRPDAPNAVAAWWESPARPALVSLLEQLEADRRAVVETEADYFVLALPLEQLAYTVTRTTMLTFLAPELRDVVKLARHMDWMAGIQFYLRSPVTIAPGHLVGVDSTWALTAIEHTQFWKDVSLPPKIKGILSVDVSAWDQRGRTVRKEAFNCSDTEIAREVWAQLSEMLNKDGHPAILRDDMLVGGELKKGVSFHIDDSLVDLRDRKKQAFYERARGVGFSTLDLVREGEDAAPAHAEAAYMWGPRLRYNAEPLLINRVGSRKLRPEAHTSIPNLFLAGDYVRTETDLACMEGANEAARRAVNGILEATGSREARCELWPFSPSRQVAAALVTVGGALVHIESAAAAVSGMRNRFLRGVAGGLLRVQGGGSSNDWPPRGGPDQQRR